MFWVVKKKVLIFEKDGSAFQMNMVMVKGEGNVAEFQREREGWIVMVMSSAGAMEMIVVVPADVLEMGNSERRKNKKEIKIT